jgi:hypothetical protein
MDVLEQADELDAQHEHRRAAELRVQALGPRPYPLLICETCSVVTGWLGSDGACVMCWTRKHDRDANRVMAADARPRRREQRVPLGRRLARTLGLGAMREWLSRIDPGDTGPTAPEEGWETESAVKWDEAAPEGPHRVVRFDVQTYRFEYGAWRPCDGSRGGKPRRLVPRELGADLPIEQLAEAWNDFEAEVAAHNRRFWQTEAARRGVQPRTPDEERGVADLLG